MTEVLNVVKVVFWGAVLLSVLVGLHEGGHYLVGRAFGMRATEFFLGMPCRLKLSFRSKSHGTEFGVTPLLLGGYTKICGMEGLPSDNCSAVMAAVAKLGIATADEIAHEAGLSTEEVEDDLQVLIDWGSIHLASAWSEKDEAYTVPAYRTLQRDPELRSIYDKGHDFTLPGTTADAEPHALVPASQIAAAELGNSALATSPEAQARAQASAFLEREKNNTYLGKGFWPRVLTLLAGPVVNLILGIVGTALVLSIAGYTVISNTNVISEVSADSVAQEIGLKAGDAILEVDGTATNSWLDITSALDDALATKDSFEIVFQHEGAAYSTSAEVEVADVEADGRFGITASTELYHPALSESLPIAWSYLTETAASVGKLFVPTQTAEVISNSSSVVGISVMAAEAVETGPSSFIYLMAVVSLSLGIMNLLPIPPLDGGKILIEIIGAVRKKPVSIKWQERISLVGLCLFLLIFVVALRQDILRFVIGG